MSVRDNRYIGSCLFIHSLRPGIQLVLNSCLLHCPDVCVPVGGGWRRDSLPSDPGYLVLVPLSPNPPSCRLFLLFQGAQMGRKRASPAWELPSLVPFMQGRAGGGTRVPCQAAAPHPPGPLFLTTFKLLNLEPTELFVPGQRRGQTFWRRTNPDAGQFC